MCYTRAYLLITGSPDHGTPKKIHEIERVARELSNGTVFKTVSMYDSILIPTDGSQDMAPVADQAIEFASLCGAEVHVLHVVDERAYLSVPDDARDQVRETLEEDGHAFTKAIAERAVDADLEVVRELRWGDPAAAILSYTVENDIDAIVMGTHGRTGYERYLLGSVAEKVVRIAPVPVLTIAVGDTDQQIEDIATASASGSTIPQKQDDHDLVSTPDQKPEEPDSR